MAPQATQIQAATPARPATSPTAGSGAPAATPNTAGRAITANDLAQSWAAHGITSASAETPGISGFAAPPSGARLTKGGVTIDVVVFVYPSMAAAEQDWNLGAAASPKTGKTAGDYAAVWWNDNVVVMLRQRVGNLTDEARDAFLNLGGPVGALPTPAPASPGTSPSPSPTASPRATGSATVSPTGSTSASPTAAAGSATPPVSVTLVPTTTVPPSPTPAPPTVTPPTTTPPPANTPTPAAPR